MIDCDHDVNDVISDCLLFIIIIIISSWTVAYTIMTTIFSESWNAQN